LRKTKRKTYFLAGAAGGCVAAGALSTGAGTFTVVGAPPPGVCIWIGVEPPGAGALFVTGAARSNTVEPVRPVRVAITDNVNDVSINNPAAIVVAFDNTVAAPRGPKAVCDPIPPKAPARSAALPLCNRTTITRKKHTITWTIVNRMIIGAR